MRKTTLLLFVLMGFANVAWGQLFDDAWDANDKCIDLKINYRVCGTCPFCWPCADIKYWVPKWVVEAGRKPEKQGTGKLHFYHVKVMPATRGLFQQPCNENKSCIGGCFRPTLGAVVDHFYDSRSDDDWLLANERMTSDRGMPPWATFMTVAPPTGTWGRTLPRAGHVIHTSPLAASGMAALRGFNISRYPYDLWPQEGRYRLDACRLPDCGPLVPNAQFPEVGPFPCMQLEKPKRLGCAAAGFDFSNAFRAAGTAYEKGEDGQYTWVIWKHRRCTCPVPLGICAEQLRGLGDDNRCVAPGPLASVVREVGEVIIGEVRNTTSTLAENLQGQLETQVGAITESFARVTESVQGPGVPPVETPTGCNRPGFESCQATNSERQLYNERLNAGEAPLPMLDCSVHRSFCCQDAGCAGRLP